MRPIINGPNDMEDFKKKMNADMNDKEIVFSKSIKAGKRIYYLDVKKNRKDEMFLAITESKKVVMVEGDDSQNRKLLPNKHKRTSWKTKLRLILTFKEVTL